jgi:hypothetical protein
MIGWSDFLQNLLFRETEIENLEKAVTRTVFLADRITIIGISGKAGVGKSILTNHVLSQVEQKNGSILRLSVNGSSTARCDDFCALIDKLTLVRVEGSQNSNEAFPHTRNVVRKHTAFANAVSDEMDRKNLDQALKGTMLAMIRAGRYANKLVPHTKKFVNFEALEKPSESKRIPEKELASLASFATREVRFLPSPIQNALGITLEMTCAEILTDSRPVHCWTIFVASFLIPNSAIPSINQVPKSDSEEWLL